MNPIILISIIIIIGKLVGKLSIKHFSLGSSAILFVGIIMSEVLVKMGYTDIAIPKIVFSLSLNAFVTVVALLAASSLVEIVKKYGIKFAVLGLVVTGTGISTILISSQLLHGEAYRLTGIFVGALTSSPGFGNALEMAATDDLAAKITVGYILGYMPGVISVILFGTLTADKSKKAKKGTKTEELSKSEEEILAEVETTNTIEKKTSGLPFDIVKLCLIMVVGLVIGGLKLHIGTMSFALGGTGGCLFSALIFGASSKKFQLREEDLNIIKEISICAFLAYIGLQFGHRAVESIMNGGFILLPVAVVVAVFSILVGYFFGTKVLKIEKPLVAGAICGGMTSTPGLAATLEAYDDKKVVMGYGATYPFGLIFTIVFIKLII